MRKSHVDKIGLILSCLLWVGALIIFYVNLSHNEKALYALYNSDALYLPALYRDLFENSGQIQDWWLTPSPYFFPDMAIYFILNAILPNAHVAILAFVAVQACMLLCALWACIVAVYANNKADSYMALTVGTLGLAALYTWVTFFDTGEYYPIFVSGFHMGALIMAFFTLALVLHIYRMLAPSFASVCTIIFLCALITLTTVSDFIFIPQGIFPIAVILVLLMQHKVISAKKTGLLLGFIGAAAMLGMYLNAILIKQNKVGYFLSMTTLMPPSLTHVMDQILQLGANQPLIAFLSLVSFTAALVIILRHPNVRNGFMLNQKIFIIFLLSCIIGAAIGEIATNNFAKRYFIPFYVIPVFVLLPFILLHAYNKYWPSRPGALWLLIAPLLLQIAYITTNRSQLISLAAYYPANIQCLDTHLQARHLTYGVSGYWDAKRISFLSRAPTHLVSVYSGLFSPYTHINNKTWYDHDFNFVIFDQNVPDINNYFTPMHKRQLIYSRDHINEAIALNRFGPPLETFQCGSLTVMIYPHSPLERDRDKAFRDYIKAALGIEVPTHYIRPPDDFLL